MSTLKDKNELLGELNELSQRMASKKRRIQRKRLWFELFVSSLGYGFLWYNTNGWVVFAIFCLLFGNNLGITRTINGKENNSSKEIWKED
jgi:hypothetical protein